MAVDHQVSRVEDVSEAPDSKRGWSLSLAALGTSIFQGLCVFAVAINGIKALLGITSVAAAATPGFFHSDPVRITFRWVAVVLAVVTLFVLWNGWYLRTRKSSAWRRRPLTKKEKFHIGFALVSSVVTLLLVVGEIITHPMIHPPH